MKMSFTRWISTFLGFPLGGLVALLVVGSVDGPISATIGGLLAGAVIGTAQWLALRSRGVGPRWAIYTTVATAAGSGVAATVTDAGTTVSSLVVSGLVTGAAVGAAQGVVLARGHRIAAVWAAVVSLAWGLGWLVSANVLVDPDRGYFMFGSSGAIVATLLTGFVLRRILGRHRASSPTAVPVAQPVTAAHR